MKIHGVKWEWDSPIFCLKKHFCPICNEKLDKIKTETIVNSASEEAKNYDFSLGDGFYVGNVKFIRTAFRCNTCNHTYTIGQLKEAESAKKKYK